MAGSLPWRIPDLVDFSTLSAVQLFIGAEHHLHVARAMLVAATQLESLEIYIDWDGYLKITYQDTTDRAEVSADIINILLGEVDEGEDLQESDTVIGRALRTLRIRGLDLSITSERIFNAIRPSALRSLGLRTAKTNPCSYD